MPKNALILSIRIILFLLLSTTSFASTQFHLAPINVEGEVRCNYLEINEYQAFCTYKDLLTTYDLSQIRAIEVSHGGKKYLVKNFTEQNVAQINKLNSEKIQESELARVEKRKNNISITDKIPVLKYLSFKDVTTNHASATLFIIGAFIFLVGSISYLITTFRVGVMWGLGCLLLPIFSIIFLFVHWKVASKPFLITMLGIAVACGGTALANNGTFYQGVRTQARPVSNQKNTGEQFQCTGKVYCSEMTSCEEAKFYLRNCIGTKMDGDNDGVPCEKQWCGH